MKNSFGERPVFPEALTDRTWHASCHLHARDVHNIY